MWVPCHHDMARPQVADRADGLSSMKLCGATDNSLSVVDCHYLYIKFSSTSVLRLVFCGFFDTEWGDGMARSV
jgi:hypothetical protein